MPTGKLQKEFHEYLCEATIKGVSHNDYLISPATTFLKYTIEAKSAIDLCTRKFPRNKSGKYSSDSIDSLQHLGTAVLPAIMGHFETFQKSLFAGMFDLTVFLRDFNLKGFLKSLDKNIANVDLTRLSAYRNIGTSSIGILIADNLTGWHDPDKVNELFKAFNLNFQCYSIDACRKLKVLWQLRHSIVHTGGTLTLPDAQKVDELKKFGNQQIAFEKHFIYEVSRKLHPIVRNSTTGIGNAFKNKLLSGLNSDVTNRIDKFFEVKSSAVVWLK